MIAIRSRDFVRLEANSSTATELFELLHAGDKHWDSTVSSIFFQARQLAASAVSENSESSLIVAAFLCRPCQILASGSMQAGDWTSDSLHETGTYDWLETNFGKEIAETIRLQPFAKRFLATVIPKYFSCLTTSAQFRVVSDGGFMNASERMTFGNNRCHHHAMKIASWIDRGVERHVQVPEMDFFLPFIEHAIGSFGTAK
jgi:predicted HD phosphohydrolase